MIFPHLLHNLLWVVAAKAKSLLSPEKVSLPQRSLAFFHYVYKDRRKTYQRNPPIFFITIVFKKVPIIHLYTSGIELSLLIIWQRKFTLNKSGKYYYNNFKELSSSAGTWEEQQGEEKRKNQQQNSKRKKKINKNRVKKMLIHYERRIMYTIHCTKLAK